MTTKRITLTLTITLALIFGMTAMSHAFWGLPKKSFGRAIEKALKHERYDRPEEAKEQWQIALEKGNILLTEGDPEKSEYLIGTARAHYGLGDYAKAAELYEKMLKVKTDAGYTKLNEAYPWVYVYLGLTYAKLNDSTKAIEYWEQVPMTIGKVYSSIQDQLAALKGKKTAEK